MKCARQLCPRVFEPRRPDQRYCSIQCGSRVSQPLRAAIARELQQAATLSPAIVAALTADDFAAMTPADRDRVQLYYLERWLQTPLSERIASKYRRKRVRAA